MNIIDKSWRSTLPSLLPSPLACGDALGDGDGLGDRLGEGDGLGDALELGEGEEVEVIVIAAPLLVSVSLVLSEFL